MAMSEQDGKQASTLQPPTTNDSKALTTYWKEQGQPWRTEPEIDLERQVFLTERRSIPPDIKQGIYPFKDIKLSRADVEWMLATHENGKGAVDWKDESQRKREGLDLRGANVRQEDLSGLPLAHMRGGLTYEAWKPLQEEQTEEQINRAAVQLQGANLREAQMQKAILRGAQLQGAILVGAQLQEAYLFKAQLQRADLFRAQLQEAMLVEAQLQRADLGEGQLQGAELREAQLEGVFLNDATLSDERHGTVLLADIQWGEVNLAVIDWGHVTRLGDEELAQQEKDWQGEIKDAQRRIGEYKQAVRANRQLAVVLRNQGLNEEADHFAYRAQLLQRMVLWRQHTFGRWLFSLLLAVLSGYGYRIWRILAAYAVMVFVFALVYFVLGRYYPPHLPLHQALLESITAFHGRVFLEQFNPDTPQIWFTALEAIAGLLIEGVFIAMLIQRFFGK
jgi:uncharacterized protein YjbI with pentapeptide repeats